ncbi:MAG: TRAP transporter large permease subunit [Deltaproteobacteria bacterium]|nr:TRAP transporter large permease subunit [Deltaproteobacteria bacterium]
MNNLDRSESLFDRVIFGSALGGGILILLTALFVTYEVILRYFFNSPTTWVLEVSIYTILASTFLSFAYILKNNGHIRVDFVTNHLSGRTALILEIFTSLLSILYCLVMTWEGGKMAFISYQSGEVSPTVLRIPLFIPLFFVPLGGILLTIQFIRLVKKLFNNLTSAEFAGEGERVLRQPAQGPLFSQMLVTGIFAVLLVVSLILLKVSMNLGLLTLFFVLLLSGLPVAVALGLFGVFGFYFLFGGASMLVQIPVVAYSTMDNFVIVALPLFILTASVLRIGGVAPKLFKFAYVLVRHLPGGMGIAAVIFCGLFAAMTGSSVAVAAAASMIALPELLSRGYDRKLAIGLLAAGGTLGILFPPSLALILYGVMTNESVGSLFLASLIPGLLLSVMFCLYVAVVAGWDNNIQREPRASCQEILGGARGAAGGLFTILIIIGGIYSGIFTPTEAGGVAGIYGLILCCFISRTVSWEGLKKILLDATMLSSMILLIIIGANITGQMILMAQITQNILAFVKALDVPPWVVILSINIFLIIMGMPLEAVSIMVITLPLLYPLVTELGFSGLWFAVVMVINMELALISPPEGINLFIIQTVAKSTSSEVSRGVFPFLIIMLLFLVLVSFVPGLTNWLPALMK